MNKKWITRIVCRTSPFSPYDSVHMDLSQGIQLGSQFIPVIQQDEMIPMPILTIFYDLKKDLNFGPNIYIWLYTYVC